MALNKTFTCNIIKDENDNDIDCYYQGYHVRTGTWNDVRYSENQQYNCNLGDGDWLTQDGEAQNGDIIILNFWVSDDEDTKDTRTGLKDRLCSIIITLTGDSTYINDIQLKPKTKPQCGFTFTDNTPTINVEVGTIPNINDNFTYTFNDITHYHYRTLQNELIFDSIGNLTLKYDFDAGDGWNTDISYTYVDTGDYTVSQKVINSYDLSKICSQDLRVRYNPPIPGMNFDYTSPLHTTEDITVNADIKDIDSRITSIKHKLIIRDRDNNDLLQDIEIDENTTKDFSYTRTIEVLQKHFFTQIVYWNDGFDDVSITYRKEVNITNWCPEVTILKVDDTDTNKIFTQTSSDKDGDIIAWHWKIFFIAPFSDGEYTEVYNYTADNGDDWEVGFTVNGDYKVQIEVTDDYGCKISDITAFEIATECNENVSKTETSNIKFIFPKQQGLN